MVVEASVDVELVVAVLVVEATGLTMARLDQAKTVEGCRQLIKNLFKIPNYCR